MGGKLYAGQRAPPGLVCQGPAAPHHGAPYGQHPYDDCPGPPVLPPQHGAGHNLPPLWGAAGNGASPVGLLGPGPCLGARPPTAFGMARPKAGQAGGPSAPPAVGAGSPRAAALRNPSMQLAHLECTGPNVLGTQFIRNVVEESIRVWYAHAKARAKLLKARPGQGSTMASALQEMRLHQQTGRGGVQRKLLE